MCWNLYKLCDVMMKLMCNFHYKLIDDVRDHCYVLREYIYIYSLSKDSLKIKCILNVI